uniref:Peptidase C1A papain C-terminal domain-containing protein n=1 Tax=Hyaloperonospora arabidopsidis (strain Emoy2) TaxID=559515 RepID=M4BGD2_HYAAE
MQLQVSIAAIALAVAVVAVKLETVVEARPMHAAIVSKYHRYLEEKDEVQTELDKWLEVYGKEGRGFIPVTESRSTEDEREDQLQRFYLTTELIKEARATNPLAEFGTQNPFTLMTMDEFQQFLQNSQVSAYTDSGPSHGTKPSQGKNGSLPSKHEPPDGHGHDSTEGVTRRKSSEISIGGPSPAATSGRRHLREAENSPLSIQIGGFSLNSDLGLEPMLEADAQTTEQTELGEADQSSSPGTGIGGDNTKGGWNFGAVSIGDGAQVAPASDSTASSPDWWGAPSWSSTSWWGTGGGGDANADTNARTWTFKSGTGDSNAGTWNFQSTMLSGSNSQGALAVNPQWTVDLNSQETPASDSQETPASDSQWMPAPDRAWTPVSESEWTPTSEPQEAPAPESQELSAQSRKIPTSKSQEALASKSQESSAQESLETPASDSNLTGPSSASSRPEPSASDSEPSAAHTPTYSESTRAPAPSSPPASSPVTPAPKRAPAVAPVSETDSTTVSSSSSASESVSSSDSSTPSDSDAVDWSTSPCVNAPSLQGRCGSCWAFASIAALEAAQCLHNGDKNASSYSKQQLVSCDTKNFGCSGGAPVYALEYLRNNGVCTESSYAYTSTEGGEPAACTKSCTPIKSGIKEVKKLEPGDESALIQALKQQPVIASVTSNNPIWKQYIKGVITSCPAAPNVDHATLIVGYDATTIKIKNSWGTEWGEDGYVRISRSATNMGTCDVLKDMSYPEL